MAGTCSCKVCCKLYFAIFVMVLFCFISWQWLFQRNIDEQGSFEYTARVNWTVSDLSLDMNYTQPSQNAEDGDANLTSVMFYCNREQMIIDDTEYESANTLGYYLSNFEDFYANTSASDIISVDEGVMSYEYMGDEERTHSPNNGFDIDRGALSKQGHTAYTIVWWISLVGCLFFPFILLLRTCAMIKTDKYIRRYWTELLVVSIVGQILLLIGIVLAMFAIEEHSCATELDLFFEDMQMLPQQNGPISASDVKSGMGETVIVMIGVFALQFCIMLVIIIILIRLKRQPNTEEESGEEANEMGDGKEGTRTHTMVSSVSANNDTESQYTAEMADFEIRV